MIGEDGVVGDSGGVVMAGVLTRMLGFSWLGDRRAMTLGALRNIASCSSRSMRSFSCMIICKR